MERETESWNKEAQEKPHSAVCYLCGQLELGATRAFTLLCGKTSEVYIKAMQKEFTSFLIRCTLPVKIFFQLTQVTVPASSEGQGSPGAKVGQHSSG